MLAWPFHGLSRPLTLVGLGLLGLLHPACGYGTMPRSEAAQLRVIAEPPEARIYVDERFVATGRALAQRPRAFEAGSHRLTIEAPGFFPHDLEVALKPGVTTLRVTLRPIPP